MTVRPISSMPVPISDIHALVLSGGEGKRMGGADKGLALFRGQALALRAALRVAPMVASVSVSANRHLDQYRALGLQVKTDDADARGSDGSAHQGPLAGVLTALRACTTAYLLVLPCDVPFFPHDLVPRLVKALQLAKTAQVAMPLTAQALGAPHVNPVFLLIQKTALPGLEAYFAEGGRKMTTWAGKAGLAIAAFTQDQDVLAFTDADDALALAELESSTLND